MQRAKEPPTKTQVCTRHSLQLLDEVEHCLEAMRGTRLLVRKIWRSFQLGAICSPREDVCA